MAPLREALLPYSAVILTGGSSGIGKSFIELGLKLKPDLRFCNLSRRPPDNFSGVNGPLFLNHFPCDLARREDIDRVAAEVGALLARTAPTGRILLINNSGIGSFGRFPEPNLAHELTLVEVNIRAMVHLTGLLLPLLKDRGGAILNLASTVAFQPTPFAATYGASKAFVLHWTLGLNVELRGSGVHALAVCPGTTRTNFFRAAGANRSLSRALSMSSDDVAEAALRALAGRRAQVVPGWLNKLYTFFSSRLPKPIGARIAAKVMARFATSGPR